jgi:hypothetical protein
LFISTQNLEPRAKPPSRTRPNPEQETRSKSLHPKPAAKWRKPLAACGLHDGSLPWIGCAQTGTPMGHEWRRQRALGLCYVPDSIFGFGVSSGHDLLGCKIVFRLTRIEPLEAGADKILNLQQKLHREPRQPLVGWRARLGDVACKRPLLREQLNARKKPRGSALGSESENDDGYVVERTTGELFRHRRSLSSTQTGMWG